jgi:ubiquitin carboxyl-terminal hydrolase 7
VPRSAPARAARPSRADTGFVGLKNQGATCYMNSMLQALFCTPAFRRVVFDMPTTGSEDERTCIPLTLQRLFCRLQVSDDACSTTALTRSFGWSDWDTMMQHDVQEFSRVLMFNLETKMQKSDLEGRIPALFRGKARVTVAGVHVSFESSREEEFYDLSLVVKDLPDLLTSLRKYTESELLDGDNQYQTDEFGKQDVTITTKFVEFPPVLHVHLRRFAYNYDLESMTKINSQFEFPSTIDLTEFLVRDADLSRPAVFDLYGVLVHSGSPRAGHYYAYLRPTTAPEWFEFNDSSVTRATAAQAIDGNFGGGYGAYGYEKQSNGYMLVYVRQCDAASIFERIDDSTIPQHLRDFVNSQKNRETGQLLSITVSTEQGAAENGCHGKIGFSFEPLHKSAQFNKDTDFNEAVYRKFSELYDIPVEEMRLWICYSKFHPWIIFENSPKEALSKLFYFTLLLQRKPVDEPVNPGVQHIFVFLKFFHPSLSSPIQYIGSRSHLKGKSVRELFPVVSEILHFPPDTEFLVFEEAISGAVTQIDAEYCSTASRVSILIFQLAPGTPLPETDYPWKSAAIPSPEAAPTASNLREVDYSAFRAHATVAQFLRGSYQALLFDYDHRETPIAKLSFPPSLTTQALREFVLHVSGIEVNLERDSVLLYPGDAARPRPTATYLRNSHGEVAAKFPRTIALHRVFMRIVRGIPQSELPLMDEAKISFSANGGLPTQRFRRFFTARAPFGVIRQALVADSQLPDVPNLRFWTTSSSEFHREITTMETEWSSYETIRIDVVPEEQQNLSEGTQLVVVHLMLDSYTPTLAGLPFYFVFAWDESVADLRARLQAAQGASDADFEQVTVVVSSNDRPRERDRIELTGKDSVRAVIVADAYVEITEVKLFLVVPPARRATPIFAHREEALKIYN